MSYLDGVIHVKGFVGNLLSHQKVHNYAIETIKSILYLFLTQYVFPQSPKLQEYPLQDHELPIEYTSSNTHKLYLLIYSYTAVQNDVVVKLQYQ